MGERSDYNAISYVYSGLQRTRCPIEFDSLADFYTWSKENGWDYGKTLRRLDTNAGYSKENCIWMDKEVVRGFDGNDKRAIRKWDEFVTRVRENLKNLPPPTPVKQQRNGREFFRYEHPDLEREGIVWSRS